MTYRDLLGKAKVWQMRLASYVAMINFVMIFYLYIIESPLGFPWYTWLVVILGVVSVVVFVDTALILPASQNYLWDKTPQWREFYSQWKSVYPVLKKMEDDCDE